MKFQMTVKGKKLPEQTRKIICIGCRQEAVVKYITNYPKRCDKCRDDKERTIANARRTRAIREGKAPALVPFAGFDPTEHN